MDANLLEVLMGTFQQIPNAGNGFNTLDEVTRDACLVVLGRINTNNMVITDLKVIVHDKITHQFHTQFNVSGEIHNLLSICA